MYQVTVTVSAQKKLLKLPANVKERISAKIDALALDPRPPSPLGITHYPSITGCALTRFAGFVLAVALFLLPHQM